jgi:hypothetical protein
MFLRRLKLSLVTHNGFTSDSLGAGAWLTHRHVAVGPDEGDIDMRKAICLMAALLFVGAAQPTQSEPIHGTAKTVQAASRPVLIPASLQARPADARGHVAVCANLAAVRALDAKAVGANYAAQDRILELTFVLCMSGPQTED